MYFSLFMILAMCITSYEESIPQSDRFYNSNPIDF